MSKVLERAKAVYDYLGIPVGGEEAYQLVHTRYHVIPEVTVNSLSW